MRNFTWKTRAGIVAMFSLLLAMLTLFADSTSRAQVPPVKVPSVQLPQPPPLQLPRLPQPPQIQLPQPPQPPLPPGAMPAPVADVRGLMNLFNAPLYLYLKQAMTEQPTSKEDWQAIEASGLQAAEVANLIALRKTKVPQQQWQQASSNLQQAGIGLARAAQTENWQASVQAYRGLIQRCNECHSKAAPRKAPQLKP